MAVSLWRDAPTSRTLEGVTHRAALASKCLGWLAKGALVVAAVASGQGLLHAQDGSPAKNAKAIPTAAKVAPSCSVEMAAVGDVGVHLNDLWGAIDNEIESLL